MSLRRALLGMSLTLGLAAALMPGAAMAAGGTIRMVDNDGHASPGHCGASATRPTHIQAAIDAAHAGDTVLVCPGTYVEQVTHPGHPRPDGPVDQPSGARSSSRPGDR